MPNYNHPSLNDDSFNRWFDTPLTPAEEPGYQSWEKKNVPQPLDPRYDMQGYYKDLVEKGKSETGINPIDHKLHFTDVYKKPSYPTFSNESKYATGPFSQIAGRWEGEQFVPPGVPTAQQEALQAPTIDPVFLAAGGLVGGEENMMGRIIDEKSWYPSSLHPPPSLIQNITNFLKGMGSNVGSGATTQALLSDHKNIGKAGGLPAGQAATNDANDLLLWARMAAKSIGENVE